MLLARRCRNDDVPFGHQERERDGRGRDAVLLANSDEHCIGRDTGLRQRLVGDEEESVLSRIVAQLWNLEEWMDLDLVRRERPRPRAPCSARGAEW
jgi:hypothetical protein